MKPCSHKYFNNNMIIQVQYWIKIPINKKFLKFKHKFKIIKLKKISKSKTKKYSNNKNKSNKKKKNLKKFKNCWQTLSLKMYMIHYLNQTNQSLIPH